MHIKRNCSDHQPGLSFITHLFNQKQLEAITASRMIEISGSQLPSLTKKSFTTRLNLKPTSIEIVNFRSKSTLKEQIQPRITTPNKACRIRALKFLRERQLSPTGLQKLRTSSTVIPLTCRQKEY